MHVFDPMVEYALLLCCALWLCTCSAVAADAIAAAESFSFGGVFTTNL